VAAAKTRGAITDADKAKLKLAVENADSAARTAADYRWQDLEDYRLSEQPTMREPQTNKIVPTKNPYTLLKADPAFIAAMNTAGPHLLDEFHISKEEQPKLPQDNRKGPWYRLNRSATIAAYASVAGFEKMFDAALATYATSGQAPSHFKAINSIKTSIKSMKC
jgi:hypothetical protein